MCPQSLSVLSGDQDNMNHVEPGYIECLPAVLAFSRSFFVNSVRSEWTVKIDNGIKLQVVFVSDIEFESSHNALIDRLMTCLKFKLNYKQNCSLMKRMISMLGMVCLLFTGGIACGQGGPRPSDLGASKLDLGEPGIVWYTTWETAQAEAKRSGRPIMFVAAATQCHGVSGVF